MRTCKERGIETVAVFSDVDRLAPHVQMADRAIAIGPAPAAQSYLVIDKIIAACKAKRRRRGPSRLRLPVGERRLRRCVHRRRHHLHRAERRRDAQDGKQDRGAQDRDRGGHAGGARDNGPRGQTASRPASEALAAAKKIGFPVLIKAAAGGGGKGMRLVANEGEFTAAFDGARREATSAFGDGTVYLEKAIERPRHIEIQVFGDTHGNLVHLGERDCSIQRRHQKVIEEAPSPVVTPELRARMGAAAVAAARAVRYVGAGTVRVPAEVPTAASTSSR